MEFLATLDSPDVKCSRESCAPPPMIGSAICKPVTVAGECCPSYTCVSANPPSINVCEVTDSSFEIEISYSFFTIETNRTSCANRKKNIVKFRLKRVKTEVGCHRSAFASEIPLPFRSRKVDLDRANGCYWAPAWEPGCHLMIWIIWKCYVCC